MPFFTAQGRSMFYLDEGEGYPILFGHCYLCDADIWRPQIDYLKRHFRCVVPDLWAHGRSECNTHSHYRIPNLASDYWHLMQYLRCDHFAIIGMAEGGMWGCKLAINHPEAVSALVLLGTHLGEESEDRQRCFMKMLDTAEQFQYVPQALKKIAHTLFFSEETQQEQPHLLSLLDYYLNNLSPYQVEGLVTLGRNLFTRTSLLEQLEYMDTPALIVCGEKDLSYPPSFSEEISNLIPYSEHKMLKYSGHLLNLERSSEVSQLIYNFLKKHSPAFNKALFKVV
jgi:pimeloyl-ACP methyl ester carboxylesterase